MESGNGFVIQLKGNCKKLLHDVKTHIRNKDPLDVFKTLQTKRGRNDNWRYTIYPIKKSQITKGWNHIKTVIEVKRFGQRDTRNYENTHYYISNLELSAQEFTKGIRGHWQIENNLHRTKDVFQKEDKNMIKNKRLAANVSILQSVTMNLFRQSGMASIKMGNEKYANRVKESLALITSGL